MIKRWEIVEEWKAKRNINVDFFFLPDDYQFIRSKKWKNVIKIVFGFFFLC